MTQLKEKINALLKELTIFHLFEHSDTTIEGIDVVLRSSTETSQYIAFHCWDTLLYLNISLLDEGQKLVHYHYEYAFAAEAAALREPTSRAEWIECVNEDDALTRAFAQLKYHTSHCK